MVPDIHDPEHWLQELRPLTNELNFAFEMATPRAHTFFTDRNRRINRPLLSNLVRYEVLEYLNSHGYNAREEVCPDSSIPIDGCGMRSLANNGIELVYRQSCLRLRKGSWIPNPTSGAAQDFYQQRLEFGDDDPLPADVVTNLVLLWDLSPNLEFAGLRLVRPTDGGPKFSQVEWDVVVPRTASLRDITSHEYQKPSDLPLDQEADKSEDEDAQTGS